MRFAKKVIDWIAKYAKLKMLQIYFVVDELVGHNSAPD